MNSGERMLRRAGRTGRGGRLDRGGRMSRGGRVTSDSSLACISMHAVTSHGTERRPRTRGPRRRGPRRRGVRILGASGGGGRPNRPSASDSVYCGMIENLPECNQPLETPLHLKRRRILPAKSSVPDGSEEMWSSLETILASGAPEPIPVDVESLDICSHPPSPAVNVECGGSGLSTPRSIHVASTSRDVITPDSTPSTHQTTPLMAMRRLRHIVEIEPIEEPSAKKSKRSLNLPSSSSVSRERPLRSDEIIHALQCASEESSDDDEDEVVPEPAIVPRVERIFIEEDEVPSVNASLTLEWPPQFHTPDSRPPSRTSDSIAAPEDPAANQLQPTSKFNFEWRAFTRSQIEPELRREPFSQINCGPTVPLASPYEAFTAIWDRKIMDHIVVETNTYAQQLATEMILGGKIHPKSRITQWQDTNVDELYVYFAIILATGIVTKTRMEEYWQKTQDVFSTPGFSAIMPFDRFVLLSRCLHFRNNRDCEEVLTRSQAKLYKVQPLLDHLNDRFSSLYNLSQNIALDESLTMWKGWLDINQFIHNKAASVGIKTYEVCESQSGYLWRFEVHAGHNDTTADPQDPISGIVPDLVLRLLKGLEHKGHTVWMDNFYNSPALARELKIRGFDCVGTLRINRQFVPTELANLSKSNMMVGQVCGCTSGDVDLVVWRDKNRVALISTYHGLATVRCGDTLKPSIVTDYNVCMGGVDRKDQMIAMYPVERKRTKIWYKKFFKRLLNASTLNAYILYKASHQTSHRAFRKDLVRELLLKHTPPQSRGVVDRPITAHFPAQYDFLAGKKHERQRRFCKICNKRSTSYCKSCNVPLCAFTCFEPYHTQVILTQ